MYMFSFFKTIFQIGTHHSEQIAKEELNKLNSQFYISRTAVEMLDERLENPLNNGKGLPPIFTEVYGKNRKTLKEYDRLDEQLREARDGSTNIYECRSKSQELHYANCTTLACFLCSALIERNVDARLFGLGGEHHCVIAKSEDPYTLLLIDPWAGIQCNVVLQTPVNNLEELSVDDRLLIAKKHFEATNLYPNYKEALDALFKSDPHCPPKLKEKVSKDFFEIQTVNRFMEFPEEPKKLTF
jgi:hypothetical protein